MIFGLSWLLVILSGLFSLIYAGSLAFKPIDDGGIPSVWLICWGAVAVFFWDILTNWIPFVLEIFIKAAA